MQPCEAGRPIRCSSLAGSVACIIRRIGMRSGLPGPAFQPFIATCQPKSHTRMPLAPRPRMPFSFRVPSAR